MPKPEPLFLFSLPRSGSTLLQRMLSSHSQITTQSELWFLIPLIETMGPGYSKSMYDRKTLARAHTHLRTMLPGGEADYEEALRAFADVLYTKLAVRDSMYILDKTPRYYLMIDQI